MKNDVNLDLDVLNDEQERTLMALLNLIIPPSEDGRMPGAVDVNFLTHLNKEGLFPCTNEELLLINKVSHEVYNHDFSELVELKQKQLIDKLPHKLSKFLTWLTSQVIYCYYQDDEVLRAIGLGARPLFPEGHFLKEGDLALLEPVYERGKFYKD
ncbi:MAG: hypothetical protein HOM87_04365 [Proteobacteria bacterium]|jgi:hypothetical protein|nr:hypothetical protein [Pseudomonadota bacterium]MBT5717902.1 hypothetical protein [Opitutae bacterium]